MARPRVIGIALGALAGGTATVVAGYLAGGGHGTYVPAVALFPFAMLSTRLTANVISGATITLALLQFPIYGLVTASARPTNRTRVVLTLVAVHIGVGAVSFAALRGGAFV
ncbi:MAG TPA: hypothetical protein VNN25_18440 [Thermoanaerobaculia bacterium]|nr:hypothetical protein [Thermoanaerobaculia bacterium]